MWIPVNKAEKVIGGGCLQQRFLAKTPELGSEKAYQLILGAAILLVVSLTFSGCAKNNASPAPRGPMPVAVVKVRQADVPLTGQWVGTLDGYVNAQIQPQVSGYLIRKDYREGSTVQKGQVLFEIDPRPFQALVDQAQGQVAQAESQVSQAQAQVNQTQAQLGLAQINVNRDTPLAKARAIAQSQLDNDKQTETEQEAAVRSAQAVVKTAQASVVSAQAALDTAKLNLGFTHVRSLISGVAGQATTQVGNLVSPQSVLTSVSQLDPIKVYFSISDAEYLALTTRARQTGGDLLHSSTVVPLTLTLANGETYPHKGKIEFVDRQINQQTGAIRIAATFPNPGNILRPGQFGRVTAQTQVLEDALLAPQIAVQELQGTEQIYTVDANSRVHIVNVKLGPQYGNYWVIQSGAEPGMSVITDNLQKLREGAPVSPHAATSDAAPTSTTQSAGN
jgi:membrane fusion protein (multidrug efflux system)